MRVLRLAALLLAPSWAWAEEPPPDAGTPVTEAPPPESARVEAHTGFGIHSAASVSIDNGAFAAALGARYAIAESWLVGLDAEYNPWFSFEGPRVARGAFNGYATFIFRQPVSERVSLRVSAHIGTSVLLFDLVGAPAGSVGPLVGGNLLGLSYEVGEQLYLLVDPAQVMLPVPQVQGAPFSYHQYRFTLGVQYGG